MSDASFQNFLVGGLLVLIGSIAFMAWSVWRYVDRERDMERASLEGVGHEMRINLQRLIAELSAVAHGEVRMPSDLMPMSFPQLKSVLSRPVESSHLALSVIHAAYEELDARKLDMRACFAEGEDASVPLEAAITAMIAAIGTLYLWEEHKGAAPDVAHSTRTWEVRDWMKRHKFDATAIPGMHLRDEVVESLRSYGMTLTPKPLTHTANEYYAMKYDRMADPRGPFGRRRIKTAPMPVVEEAVGEPEPAPEIIEEAAAPEPVAETPAEIAEPVAEMEAAPAPEPEPVPEVEPSVEITEDAAVNGGDAPLESAPEAADGEAPETAEAVSSETPPEADAESEEKPVPA